MVNKRKKTLPRQIQKSGTAFQVSHQVFEEERLPQNKDLRSESCTETRVISFQDWDQERLEEYPTIAQIRPFNVKSPIDTNIPSGFNAYNQKNRIYLEIRKRITATGASKEKRQKCEESDIISLIDGSSSKPIKFTDDGDCDGLFSFKKKVIDSLFFLFKHRMLSISFCPSSVDQSSLTCHVKFNLRLLKENKSYRDLNNLPPVRSTLLRSIHIFMEWLFTHSQEESNENLLNFPYEDEEKVLKISSVDNIHHNHNIFDHQEAYKQTCSVPYSEDGNCFTPPDSLLPLMRPYQKAATVWMIMKERGFYTPSVSFNKLSNLYIEVKTVNDPKGFIYYSPYISKLFWDREKGFDLNGVQGGILADEMGLGKTVEVLACILSNPSPSIRSSFKENTFTPLDESIKSIQSLSTSLDKINCLCGIDEYNPSINLVQCRKCFVLQHKECVGFNVEGNSNAYFECIQCENQNGIIPCHTTLIISPEAIHKQWESEIIRHTRPHSVSIMIYPGVKELCTPKSIKSQRRLLSPRELAKYDIIITTYEALKNDLHHSDHIVSRSLRYKKRYQVIPSPLIRLNWWRICLDEAQLVETTTAKASAMALRLSCVNRWCVSGTPISRGLEDLYGLLSFLRIEPFCHRQWWISVIQKPFDKYGCKQRLYDLLKNILWRNQKIDVEDQIQLPPQTTKLKWLQFSNVEAHFYQEQEKSCTRDSESYLKKLKIKDLKENENQVPPEILKSLLRLRQACCHPQIGSFGIRSLQHGKPMSMEEILNELINKSVLECEEEQRKMIAALNGIAGIYSIQNEPNVAIKYYIQSMKLISQHAHEFRADALQKLHILKNLAKNAKRICYFIQGNDNHIIDHVNVEKLQDNCTLLPNIPRLTKAMEMNDYVSCDSKGLFKEVLLLEHAASQIEKNYLAQANIRHDSMMFRLKEVSNEVNEEIKKWNGIFSLKPWWDNLLRNMERSSESISFIERLRAQLSAVKGNSSIFTSLSDQFNDISGLRYILMIELDKIKQTRNQLFNKLNELSKFPTFDKIAESGNCKKCRENRKGIECFQCKGKEYLEAYENSLYSFRNVSLNETTWTSKNYRGDSEVFIILKEIRKLGNSNEIEMMTLNRLNTIFDSLKKELQAASKLWSAQHQRLSALDELDMSLTTIQLHTGEEELTDSEKNFKLLKEEIPFKLYELTNERNSFEITLNQAKNRLHYLNHLKNTNSFIKWFECPICHEEIQSQDEKTIFKCGHTFCYSCIERMMERHPQSIKLKSLRCPTCRQKSSSTEITFVQENNIIDCINQRNDQDKIIIKGGFGTKIDALVRKVLYLHKSDPNIKCLVFSQWNDMLKLVSTAFNENEIHCLTVSNKKSFQEALKCFRDSSDALVFALPFKNGANGLNLTEATHVFLLEPLLNPRVEMQAINRVHRIGQEKETFVHRFLIQNTIEDRIYELNRSKSLHVKEMSNQLDKQIKEFISIKDLTILYHSKETDPEKKMSTAEIFWKSIVNVNDKEMDLRDAAHYFERLRSYDCMDKQKRIVDEPEIELYGKKLNVYVAKQILDINKTWNDSVNISKYQENIHEMITFFNHKK